MTNRRPTAGIYFNDPELQAVLDGADAALFDMNGLHVDDEPLHLEAVNYAVEHLGIVLTPDIWIDRFIGLRLSETLPAFLAENNGHAKYSTSSLIQSYRDHFTRIARERIKSVERPGVRDMIAYLSKANTTLALVTSAPPSLVDVILGENGLDLIGCFHYTVTGDMVARGKPNPDCYKKAADMAGVNPSRCVGFEDTEQGVEALYGTGIMAIAVPCRFTRGQNFNRAAYVVNDLTRSATITGRGRYAL